MTASISLSPSSIKAGGPGGIATVTVSNGAAGGVDIAILGARPIAYDQGTKQHTQAVALGLPNIGLNGQANTAAAAGTFVFTFPYNAFQPQVLGVAGGAYGPTTNLQYDIGCEVVCNNGDNPMATTATLTVTDSPHS